MFKYKQTAKNLEFHFLRKKDIYMDLSKTNLFFGLCFVSTPLLFYFGNKILNAHSNVVNTHLNVLEIKKRLIQADVDSTVYSLDELHKLKKLQLNINDIDFKINALTQQIDFLSEKFITVDSIGLKVDALTQTTNSFSEKLIGSVAATKLYF